MTPQSTFMIVATVREGQLQNLRELLATMNKTIAHADPDNTLLPFSRFDGLHFARFVIIEAKTAGEISAFGVTPRPWQPTLAFLGDIDGDENTFLADLARQAGPGLQEIFSFCEGFSKDGGDLLAWMKLHSMRPDANYINWLGRTVKQVREEAILQQSLSHYLAEVAENIDWENPSALREKLLSHVESETLAGCLTLTAPQATSSAWKLGDLLHLLGAPIILLVLSPLLLLIAPIIAIRIRMQERSDPELFIRPEREHIRQLAIQEDWDATNQYNLFGDLKPGVSRLILFKFLLFVLNYLARHVFNRGFLTRIKTIHFARWVLMDNNHRLFFASSYDGSHESYMDDFINKVGWGINLVFFSGVSYPTTRWLIKEGANRELQFKYTQRRHQIGSEVWYKAYPDLTAADLWRHSRIRQGLEKMPSNDAKIREWLSLI